MKRLLLIIASAISAATGVSIAQSEESRLLTYFYWLVAAGQGGNTDFINVELSTYYGTTAPFNPCSGIETYKCVVGFTVNQVQNVNGITLIITANGLIRQPNRITIDKRPIL